MAGQFMVFLGNGFKRYHGSQANRPFFMNQEVHEGREDFSTIEHHVGNLHSAAFFKHGLQR